MGLPGHLKARTSGAILDVHIVVPVNPRHLPAMHFRVDGHRPYQRQVATRPHHVVEEVQDHLARKVVLYHVATLQNVVVAIAIVVRNAISAEDGKKPSRGVVVELEVRDVVGVVVHVGSRDEIAAHRTLAS